MYLYNKYRLQTYSPTSNPNTLTPPSRQENHHAKEAQLDAEVQRDEERSRNFLLDEERARLEEDLRATSARARHLDTATNSSLQTHKDQVHELTNENKALSSQLRQLQDQLVQTNAQNSSLQADTERASKHLAQVREQARQKGADLDQKAAEAVAKGETSRGGARRFESGARFSPQEAGSGCGGRETGYTGLEGEGLGEELEQGCASGAAAAQASGHLDGEQQEAADAVDPDSELVACDSGSVLEFWSRLHVVGILGYFKTYTLSNTSV